MTNTTNFNESLQNSLKRFIRVCVEERYNEDPEELIKLVNTLKEGKHITLHSLTGLPFNFLKEVINDEVMVYEERFSDEYKELSNILLSLSIDTEIKEIE